jgi:hypothetical protein
MPICAGLLITFLSRFHFVREREDRSDFGVMTAIGTYRTFRTHRRMSAFASHSITCSARASSGGGMSSN